MYLLLATIGIGSQYTKQTINSLFWWLPRKQKKEKEYTSIGNKEMENLEWIYNL